MSYLSIGEEFIILSRNKKVKKTFTGRTKVIQLYAIGGLFMELLLQNELEVDANNRVKVVIDRANNNKGLQMLKNIIEDKKDKTFRGWIRYFYRHRKIRNRLFDEMEQRSQVQKDMSQPEIARKIREAILENDKRENEKSQILVLLLDSSKLIGQYFQKKERKKLLAQLNYLQNANNNDWRMILKIKKELDFIDVVILSSAVII